MKEAGTTLRLTCNTDFKGPISWKHATSEEEMDLEPEGHELEIPDFDDSGAGNYSCWDKEELLYSVYVFLADTPNSASEYFRKARHV